MALVQNATVLEPNNCTARLQTLPAEEVRALNTVSLGAHLELPSTLVVGSKFGEGMGNNIEVAYSEE